MAKNTKRMGKRDAESLINGVSNTLGCLADRVVSHIDYGVTEEDLLHGLVKPEHQDLCRRAVGLLAVRESWQLGAFVTRELLPDKPEWRFHIAYGPKLSFVPPIYIVTNKSMPRSAMTEEFAERASLWARQAVEIHEMAAVARAAWTGLCFLCKDDPAQIRFLWPSLDAVAAQFGVTTDGLPVPRTLPPMPPDLREALTTATHFVNMALLTPPERSRSEEPFNFGVARR